MKGAGYKQKRRGRCPRSHLSICHIPEPDLPASCLHRATNAVTDENRARARTNENVGRPRTHSTERHLVEWLCGFSRLHMPLTTGAMMSEGTVLCRLKGTITSGAARANQQRGNAATTCAVTSKM
eukprot:scaffold178725_cov25-Tisochrysis_lutea.AAC.4